MAEAGNLDILGEIQALVADKLQVVSYKWLSRNFLVSSNDAKRILQEFVEQNGSGLEIVYSLSGWLKISPPVYHIQLVSGVTLAEVKKQFEDNCSVQVYSVQACIPKDSAALWNSEFVQAEELFNQPSTVDNCLRDNRFCGVSNSFVKRSVNGTSLGVAPAQSKNAGIAASSRSSNGLHTPTIPQQKGKIQHSSPISGESPVVAAPPVIKTESNASETNVGKVTAILANKKKAQNEKTSSGTGGSLAQMWGRASVKPKPASPPETDKDDQNPVGNLATAEAQICAREAIETARSDDEEEDDVQCVNPRRSSNGEGNRKRRVFMDFSDEDDFEEVVNLASPDPPEKHLIQNSKVNTETSSVEKNNLNFESLKVDQSKVKQKKTTEKVSKCPRKEEEVIVSKDKTTGKPVKTPEVIVSKDKTTGKSVKTPEVIVSKDKITGKSVKTPEVIVSKDKTTSKSVKTPDPEDGADQKSKAADDASNSTVGKLVKTPDPENGAQSKATDGASNSTKRRKVLKTRIDERGREVTEVVWEGEETENKNTVKNDSVTETANDRPPVAKKSPAPLNPVSKAGAKKAGKGGVKDAKQGNIMSFFKKV